MRYLFEPVTLTFPRLIVWMLCFTCVMSAIEGVGDIIKFMR